VFKRNSKIEIQRTKSKVHGKNQQTRTRRKAKIKANYITKAKTAKQTKGKKTAALPKASALNHLSKHNPGSAIHS
jgi:hypothetical protein